MYRIHQRRYVTLIEMMIVMFLIALIIGVLAFNYQGTLEKGKAFKTEVGIEKLETILNLRLAEEPSLADNIESQWVEVVRRSSLVKNPDDLVKDGWGVPYRISVDRETGAVRISSERYDQYKRGK